MTERDRLVELMKNVPRTTRTFFDQYADYLLANGVIVPPCKVGDMLYCIGKFTGDIVELRVTGIYIPEGDDIFLRTDSGTYVSVKQQIGKSIFLTPEQAEQA